MEEKAVTRDSQARKKNIRGVQRKDARLVCVLQWVDEVPIGGKKRGWKENGRGANGNDPAFDLNDEDLNKDSWGKGVNLSSVSRKTIWRGFPIWASYVRWEKK